MQSDSISGSISDPVRDAMGETIGDVFGDVIGETGGDPSCGPAGGAVSALVNAAARGAAVIEKHFTLDRTLPGPDHQSSLEPDEFKAMVEAIRAVEQSLGSPVKIPAASEQKNKPVVRKTIVAAKPIREGEPFTVDNLTVKRAGSGISPMLFWELLGQKADRPYGKDQVIQHAVKS